MLPKHIVAFGSSSLHGLMDTQAGGFIDRLKKWHEGLHFKNLVYNLGISGDTTTGMVKRLIPEASIRKPNLILISPGTNDARRIGSRNASSVTPLERYKQNIVDLILQSKTLADVIFIGVFPIDDSKTAPLTYWGKDYFHLMKDIRVYEKMVRETCKEKDVPYMDTMSEWLKRDYTQWLFEDGLHANVIGHQMIFEQLQDLLLKLYPDR